MKRANWYGAIFTAGVIGFWIDLPYVYAQGFSYYWTPTIPLLDVMLITSPGLALPMAVMFLAMADFARGRDATAD